MNYSQHGLEIGQDVLRQGKQSSKPSNVAAIRSLAIEHTLIATSIYVTLAVSYWFYPLALILIGAGQRTYLQSRHAVRF
jgi:hypothetical protein